MKPYRMCICASFRIFWQIVISYCKFLMSKALKWNILGVCTIIVSKDIYKNLWKNLFMVAPVYFSLKNWQKSVHWNICCHQKKLEMVEKWLHISCKRFSRYILTKIAKIGKFALYSFIYLQVVPAFNGAVQVKRNIIKPTFISFPVKSWGSETTPLATHTFNRSYKMSHPPHLKASSDVFTAL